MIEYAQGPRLPSSRLLRPRINPERLRPLDLTILDD
jgi:hypothetical protein